MRTLLIRQINLITFLRTSKNEETKWTSFRAALRVLIYVLIYEENVTVVPSNSWINLKRTDDAFQFYFGTTHAIYNFVIDFLVYDEIHVQ